MRQIPARQAPANPTRQTLARKPYPWTGDGDNNTHAITAHHVTGDSLREEPPIPITPKPQTPKTPFT